MSHGKIDFAFCRLCRLTVALCVVAGLVNFFLLFLLIRVLLLNNVVDQDRRDNLRIYCDKKMLQIQYVPVIIRKHHSFLHGHLAVGPCMGQVS